jgi:hypothetical protein
MSSAEDAGGENPATAGHEWNQPVGGFGSKLGVGGS